MISVLYVDDESVLLDVCKMFLELTGELEIHTESSVNRAISRLSHEHFDAIISDYQMPEMDGIEFLKEIRATGSTIPFIIFTGRGREEVAIAALKEGADFYLQKGGDPKSQFAELANQIKQIVRQRTAESAVRESEQMYRALFEAAHDAIILMDQGLIIDCNRQTELLYGRSRDEIIGHTPMDFSPEFQPDGSSSLERGKVLIQSAIQGQDQSFEWRGIHSDGIFFDIDVSLNRIPVSHGIVLLANIRDITRRKEDEIELLRKNEEIAASYEELLGAEEELREQYDQIAQSEQALRESEDKLRSILASMDDLVFTLDADGVFQDYFRTSSEEYYIPPDVFVGRSYWDVLPPALSQMLHDAIEKVRISGTSGQIDYSLPLEEGIRYYSARLSRRLNDDGVYAGITLVARDVTAAKETDIALLEHESRLKTIIQGSPIPQFVINQDHQVIYWNDALATYSGINADEVLGTNQQWRAFYPDERPCLADLLIAGHREAFEEWYGSKFEKSSLVPDAYTAVDFFPAMGEEGVWLSFTAALIRDHTGRITGAVETLEDITRQRQSALALAESEHRYRSMIDNMQDVFYRSDREGRLVMVSPSITTLLGYPVPEDLIGKKIADEFYYNPEDRDLFLSALSKTGSVTNYPVTLIHQDGSPVFVSTSSHLYTDSDGELAGVEGTFRDISGIRQADETLRHEEAILNGVIGESPVPLFVIDADHRVLYWNRALETYSGILAEEVRGTREQWRAFYSEDRPCMADLLVDGALDRIPEWYQGKYAPSRLIDGAYEAVDFFPTLGESGCWLFFTAAPIRDPAGTLIGAIEILEDITEQKKAELEIRRLTEFQESIIMNANVWLMVLDESGAIIVWNHAAEEMSGYRYDEVAENLDIWKALYPDPGYRRQITDQIARIIREDQYLQDFQTSITTKNGETKEILWNTRNIHTDHDPGTFVAIGIDITSRKNAEHALMESEERFHTLFENASDAIFLHRILADGRPDQFIEVNKAACEKLGYTREELLKMAPGDIDTPASKEKEVERTELLRRDGHATFEAVHITRSGEEIPVEISTHIYEFRGETVVLSIARDISDRKRYESAIQNANKKLNLLSSITRHDILNQLTALTGYLELSEEITDTEEEREFIQKEKKTAETILRQILFTRDYQTIGIQSPVWHHLGATIRKAAGLLDTSSVVIESDVGDAEIFADPLLEKVFFNLIDNSLRYGKNLTRISFSIEVQDKDCFLIVSDDGGGIPPEEKENIFNRKYFNNTGFGLFLSREILAITGLSIEENGEFGSGARFEIHIPAGGYRFLSDHITTG